MGHPERILSFSKVHFLIFVPHNCYSATIYYLVFKLVGYKIKSLEKKLHFYFFILLNLTTVDIRKPHMTSIDKITKQKNIGYGSPGKYNAKSNT